MTRNIEANTPVQVNSNLIGVQVHPVAGTIQMNYPWLQCKTLGITKPADSVYSIVFSDDSENPVEYAYVAVKESGKPDGITPEGFIYPLYNFKAYNTPAAHKKSSIWLMGERGNIQTEAAEVYDVTSEVVEGETVYTATVIGKVVACAVGSPGDTMVQYEGTFLETSDGYMDMLSGDTQDIYVGPYTLDSNNWYLYDANNVLYGVSKNGITSVSKVTLSAERDGVEGWQGKIQWVGTPMRNGQPAWVGYENVNVWTDTVHPQVGDNVYTVIDDTEFNRTTVSGTEPEAVSCSVLFSVEGTSWTQVGNNLTDDNNVIANIPRYVYLMFGQPVEITEE